MAGYYGLYPKSILAWVIRPLWGGILEVYTGILSDRFTCESCGSCVRQRLIIPFNAESFSLWNWVILDGSSTCCMYFATTTLGTIQRNASCYWTWWLGHCLQPGVFWGSQIAAREIHPPVVWGCKLYLGRDGIHELLKGKPFGPLKLWFPPCQVVDPCSCCWQSQNTRIDFHPFHIKVCRKPRPHNILRVLWYILHDLNIHLRGNIFIQCLMRFELHCVRLQALSHHAEAYAWRSSATISVDHNPDFQVQFCGDVA